MNTNVNNNGHLNGSTDTNSKSVDFFINDESAMMHFGAALSESCKGGEIIFLHGELGAGKTTLVRGFMRKLGHGGTVKSPTYTLVEHYAYQEKDVYHFDLYRLGDGEELEYMGVRDYFHQNAICLIEWPERGEGYLPQADVEIQINYEAADQRCVLLSSVSQRGLDVYSSLNGLYSASK